MCFSGNRFILAKTKKFESLATIRQRRKKLNGLFIYLITFTTVEKQAVMGVA